MTKIPIVFSTDHNYVMQTGVCITSLLMNSQPTTSYDIFILGSSDITYCDKNILENTVKKFSAISTINFISIDNRFDKAYEIRDISKAAYFRLVIPELIHEYNKVIYSDVDVIFRKGLEDVINIDLGQNYWGGIKAIGASNIKDYILQMGLSPDKYINTGFLIINSDLQRKEKLYDTINKHTNKKYQFQDQDIINIIGKDRILYLPLEYCFTQKSYELYHTNKQSLYSKFSPEEVEKAFNSGIIHYEGTNKPWNAYCYRYDSWWYYYKHSLFFDEKKYFQEAYNIQHHSWSLKEILRLLRNFTRGDYKNDKKNIKKNRI